jgi:hypothetical protein
MQAMHNMRRLRGALVALGILSLVGAAGLSLQISPFTAVSPLGDASTVDLYLSAYVAAIGVSLLWIGMSGELEAAEAGAISLTVTYTGLAISFLVLSRGATDPRLSAAALLCTGAAVLSAGTTLWFRRFLVRDGRPLHQTVRLSFTAFALMLGVVGAAVLLGMPNVFPLALGPASSALVGCSFLGSAVYFLYSLTFPVWSNAHAQLWGFLAYDLVLIVPFLLRLGSIDSAHLPALLVNLAVLVYSGALAIYYLVIAKATRVLGHALCLFPLRTLASPLPCSISGSIDRTLCLPNCTADSEIPDRGELWIEHVGETHDNRNGNSAQDRCPCARSGRHRSAGSASAGGRGAAERKPVRSQSLTPVSSAVAGHELVE